MPRQARLDASGTLHHVIIRGIEKRRGKVLGSGTAKRKGSVLDTGRLEGDVVDYVE